MADKPSAVPAVIDYLVAVAGTVIEPSSVYDGPPSTSANKQTYLAIGWDGDPDNLLDQFASVEQEWAEIGALAKNEIGHVTCAVVRWSGDKSAKGRRDEAFALLSAFENALRAALRTDDSPTGLQSHVLWIGVTAGSLTQGQIDNGVQARVEFTVDYAARI